MSTIELLNTFSWNLVLGLLQSLGALHFSIKSDKSSSHVTEKSVSVSAHIFSATWHMPVYIYKIYIANTIAKNETFLYISQSSDKKKRMLCVQFISSVFRIQTLKLLFIWILQFPAASGSYVLFVTHFRH